MDNLSKQVYYYAMLECYSFSSVLIYQENILEYLPETPIGVDSKKREAVPKPMTVPLPKMDAPEVIISLSIFSMTRSSDSLESSSRIESTISLRTLWSLMTLFVLSKSESVPNRVSVLFSFSTSWSPKK